MQDVSLLSLSDKTEIAGFIKRDNLSLVDKLVEEAHVKESFYTKHGKRILDFCIALIGFIITLPINLFIAVVTFFDVGNPIIFRQTRIGKYKKEFTIYKFRNMTNEKDKNGELLPPSKRVTKWGKFVRKTSLDELLNFVSILDGSMSIIGPRPLMDYYVERLNKRHLSIYEVRPGLECPTIDRVDHALTWQERLDNYVWYVENCSLWIDIKLCIRMVSLTLNKKETKRRSEASCGGFMGYNKDGSIIYSKSVPDIYVEEFCRKHQFSSLEDAIKARTFAV